VTAGFVMALLRLVRIRLALRRLCLLHFARKFRLDLPANDVRHGVVLLLRNSLQPRENLGREADADLADWSGLSHQAARYFILDKDATPAPYRFTVSLANHVIVRRNFDLMNAPADIQPAIESELARVARELDVIGRSLERLESLIALIASAAVAK
jgi:hypothetical protein